MRPWVKRPECTPRRRETSAQRDDGWRIRRPLLRRRLSAFRPFGLPGQGLGSVPGFMPHRHPGSPRLGSRRIRGVWTPACLCVRARLSTTAARIRRLGSHCDPANLPCRPGVSIWQDESRRRASGWPQVAARGSRGYIRTARGRLRPVPATAPRGAGAVPDPPRPRPGPRARSRSGSGCRDVRTVTRAEAGPLPAPPARH